MRDMKTSMASLGTGDGGHENRGGMVADVGGGRGDEGRVLVLRQGEGDT